MTKVHAPFLSDQIKEPGNKYRMLTYSSSIHPHAKTSTALCTGKRNE